MATIFKWNIVLQFCHHINSGMIGLQLNAGFDDAIFFSIELKIFIIETNTDRKTENYVF